MKILVTGVSGQVGGALAKHLRSLGEVVEAPRTLLDLSKPWDLEARLTEIRPDLIVNAAAYTAVDKAEEEPELAFRVNAEAVAALGTWARRHRKPIAHFSTDYVFDGSGERPFLEDDPINPLSVYGKSKAEGDRLLKLANPAYLIIRVSWVYAAQGKNFLRTIARFAREREQLRIVSDQFGAPTSAEQIAQCAATILSSRGRVLDEVFAEAKNVVHFSASGVTSWHGFATAIVDGLRARGVALRVNSISAIPTSEYPTAAKRPANSRLDTGRIEALFGVAGAPWQSALERELDLLGQELQSSGRP
ncbi:MAG: dTDP-4-dehydrorhamnose reductase [Rhodomicrobium sp.]|jgi:dTDP-4-dehydrorhamnose reductase